MLEHYDPDGALRLHDQLVPIYTSTHADLLHLPWYSADAWWTRLSDLYARTPDFDLVVGRYGQTTIGYAFGSPRDDESLWSGIGPEFPDLEPAGPVYIFREFAVSPDSQRRGFGKTIHDELLRSRPEQAAHLLVRGDNVPALAAYRSWGWVCVGKVRPFPDSPTFDAMALNLASRKRKGAAPHLPDM